MSTDVQQRIHEQVTAHPVVLYMKGSPKLPQCGFSANAIRILSALGVNELFTVDVLQDAEIRQGIKDYANWPTIPQLYVRGEFIGGSDIMTEMHQNGELKQLLEDIAGVNAEKIGSIRQRYLLDAVLYPPGMESASQR